MAFAALSWDRLLRLLISEDCLETLREMGPGHEWQKNL